MSEFSESYHLRSSDREDVVKLLRASGNTGYVFPEANGWITFVIEGSDFDLNQPLLEHNPATLVHYIYAEDHGFEVGVLWKNEVVFEFECDWNDDIEISKYTGNLDVIKELVLLQGNSIAGIEELFKAESMFSDITPAYELAERIGLVHYAWLSADYAETNDTEADILPVK
ncbi:hypothetical protein [Paenibacillus sp. 22594]|uniref:hypothetical protein n=1 Tax=Paenibacillus sp. 22594 TaxID=3453947 RepID=UPI003F83A748